jgi:hypothetical protein
VVVGCCPRSDQAQDGLSDTVVVGLADRDEPAPLEDPPGPDVVQRDVGEQRAIVQLVDEQGECPRRAAATPNGAVDPVADQASVAVDPIDDVPDDDLSATIARATADGSARARRQWARFAARSRVGNAAIAAAIGSA